MARIVGREARVLACTGCGVRQPAEEFALHERRYVDGDGRCKLCVEGHRRQLIRDSVRRHGEPDPATPLVTAIKAGNFGSVMASLLARPEQVHATDASSGRQPLHEALGRGDADVVALLLDSGASANMRTFLAGDSPMHIAATVGKKRLAEMLLAHGARVDCANKYGQTPLHCCTDSPLANLLIREGADFTARDKAGRTPSAIAHARGDWEMSQFFTRLGQARARQNELLEAKLAAIENERRRALDAKRQGVIHEKTVKRENSRHAVASTRISNAYVDWRSAGSRSAVVDKIAKSEAAQAATVSRSWSFGRPGSAIVESAGQAARTPEGGGSHGHLDGRLGPPTPAALAAPAAQAKVRPRLTDRTAVTTVLPMDAGSAARQIGQPLDRGAQLDGRRRLPAVTLHRNVPRPP